MLVKDYTIKDKNIVLKNHFEYGYLKDFIEIANDKEFEFLLMSHNFPYSYTEEDANFFINKNRENGNEIFAIDFYIFYHDNIAGVIGISNIDYINMRGHIGYWIGKKFRNKGIATESVNIMMNFAKNELRLHSLYTTVLTDNVKSINVLLKNHFEITGIDKDTFYYRNNFYSAYLLSRIL